MEGNKGFFTARLTEMKSPAKLTKYVLPLKIDFSGVSRDFYPPKTGAPLRLLFFVVPT